MNKTILFYIFSSSWGGAENYLLSLLRYLEKSGKVTARVYGNEYVIKQFQKYGDDIPSAELVSIGGFSLPKFRPFRICKKVYNYFLGGWRLSRFLKHEEGQTINTHLQVALWTFWIAKLFGAPLHSMEKVLTFHYWEIEHIMKKPKLFWFSRQMVKSMDKYIFLHEDTLRWGKELDLIKDDNAIRTNLAVDTSRFVPEKKIPHRISYVARMIQVKHPEFAIEALPLILEQIPEVHLDMIGDGVLLPAMKQRAKELGVESAITFYGAIDDVAPIIKQSEVYLSLLDYDNYESVATKEAIAAGNVVMSFDLEGSKNIREYKLGALVPMGDVAALAASTIKILQQRDLLAGWSEKNQKFAREKFDNAVLFASYVDFLQK
ncbi:glycosyltransferase family 4 protein [Patescibacteria group bacterium]